MIGFFKKNANEANYPDGRKHWCEVIKNSGPEDALLWRQPEEDFNTNSTVIVMPGESAVFVKQGHIVQVLESTAKLSTENYPFVSRLRNAFTGGVSVFNCVVYFVRSADTKELLWGTDKPIQIQDKVWNIMTNIKARAAYRLRITDAALFMNKLIGSKRNIPCDKDLDQYFFNLMGGNIRSFITEYLNVLSEELIGVEAHMNDMSEAIKDQIDEMFESYGLSCVQFQLLALNVDETRYKALHAARDKEIEFRVLGENWNRQKQVELMGDYIQNVNGTGSEIAGQMMGLGAGLSAGQAMGNMFGQFMAENHMQQPIQQQPIQQQPVQQPIQQQYEKQQSEKQQPDKEDAFEVLSKLKKFLDAGLISQEKYDAKVDEIMSRM